jgi:hypothetical protein
MSLSAIAFHTRRGVPPEASAELRERWILRRVGIVWGLLVLNAATFYAGFPLVIPIPYRLGQVITQGALPLALAIALTVNRRVIVRPNLFLCLVSLLILDALVTSLQPGHIGTVYRSFRFAEFVAALWLISPWWGRRDLLLLRYYLRSLMVVLGTVIIGLLAHPGAAMGGGRLTGVLWPIPATEVAHYAAIVSGSVIVLWLGGEMRGRVAGLAAVAGTVLIVLTHTRTALIALVAGILIAGLSLFTAKARVRKFLATAGAVASIAVMTAASLLTTWLARGEKGESLDSLSGRTDFWTLVVHVPRNKFQEIAGFGLSNASINGFPIDSNWLTAYMEQGLFGVFICAAMVLFLLIAAFFQPPGIRRALTLFLVTYSLIASFTQVGMANPTTYLLELSVAAALLVPSTASRRFG